MGRICLAGGAFDIHVPDIDVTVAVGEGEFSPSLFYFDLMVCWDFLDFFHGLGYK